MLCVSIIGLEVNSLTILVGDNMRFLFQTHGLPLLGWRKRYRFNLNNYGQNPFAKTNYRIIKSQSRANLRMHLFSSLYFMEEDSEIQMVSTQLLKCESTLIVLPTARLI